MARCRILSVEDDKAVRNLISVTLEGNGYDCWTAGSGERALELVALEKPDIVLLDLGLPDMDGVDVIKRIRTWSSVPIIVISARSEDRDKIEALDEGADDYLTKPFSVVELLARLRSTLRRISFQDPEAERREEKVFENGLLRIDSDSHCAWLGEEEIHFTPIEYKILMLLAKNEGKILTQSYITKVIWGSTTEKNVASLRVFMATLRRKLEKGDVSCPRLETHVGIGYRMIRL